MPTRRTPIEYRLYSSHDEAATAITDDADQWKGAKPLLHTCARQPQLVAIEDYSFGGARGFVLCEAAHFLWAPVGKRYSVQTRFDIAAAPNWSAAYAKWQTIAQMEANAG